MEESIEIKKIKPQEGPQKLFFETNAEIIIYGGSAGGGASP